MKKNYTVWLLMVLLLASLAAAQEINPALRPPKGVPVAIVVFEDLQCPKCRLTAPLVAQAAKTYKVPVIRHDFPLQIHNWSGDAAIIAHYFDARSKQLGNDFRDYIFSHQMEIYPGNLRSFADKFAADHKVELPFVVDPQGKLAAEINAEKGLGMSVGLYQTPTVYVVSSKPKGTPYVEVKDPQNELYQTIEAMQRQ